jgi:hypothetical protein
MLRRTAVPKLPVTWRTITGTGERRPGERFRRAPPRRAVAACVCCSRAWPVAAVHLVFSASEVLAGAEVTDWPLRQAVLVYRFPAFVIFVVQSVFQVITAESPSSFQVPVIPSPRVAFAAPPPDSVTGGPGVGKTTIVKAILRVLAAKGTACCCARRRGEPPSA